MNKIDLHGIKHADVKIKVIHFIEDNWNTNTNVEIITGCSDRMIELVSNVVDEYDLVYRIGIHQYLSRDRVIVFME